MSILDLTHDLEDREVLKMGIKVAKRIAATSPLSDLIESMTNPSTDSLDDYINENLGVSP